MRLNLRLLGKGQTLYHSAMWDPLHKGETMLTLSQTTILDSSKLKEFPDDNLKFVKNGRMFFKQVENTVGKGKIAHYEQFLLSQQCFQKNCTADT